MDPCKCLVRVQATGYAAGVRKFLSSLLACSIALSSTCRAGAVAPAFESNPDFVKARAEAQRLAKSPRDQAFAADAWRKANRIAGGQCMDCFLGMMQAERNTGDTKAMLRDATAMEQAATAAADRSVAELFQGRAYMDQAGRDKPKPALVEQAHAAFAKSAQTDSSTTAALYMDGMALATLNRNDEAKAAFKSYLAHSRPSDIYRARAERLVDNPELVHQKMAPPVVVTSLAGKQFNLDRMGGRVVLIDFWATWCGPCNKELPHMQKLAAKYSSDPFEIISISWDSDEAKWKSFIADHNMTWNQYRDTTHKLTEAFGINSIPHYFTIDSDGVLTAENVGSGSMSDTRIEQLVQRARQQAAASHNQSAMADRTE